MTRWDAKGPYIVWSDGGLEGWAPRSYDTIKEALSDSHWASNFIITKVVDFEVIECPEKSQNG